MGSMQKIQMYLRMVCQILLKHKIVRKADSSEFVFSPVNVSLTESIFLFKWF